MLSVPVYRLAIASALVVVIVVVVSGQSPPAADRPGSPMEELLAEVRGLRTEIGQAAGASIRAQLLVARLQLQEQRINTISRQLTDIQEQLRGNEHAKTLLAPQLKVFEGAQNKSGVEKEQSQEMDHVISTLKSQLAQFEKNDNELRGRQAEYSSLLAEEQARWSEFNARLDELERALVGRAPR